MDKKKTEVAKVIASLALNPEEISKDKQSKIALRNPAIAAYIAKQVIPELRDIKIHDIFKSEDAIKAVTNGMEEMAKTHNWDFTIPDYKNKGLNLYYNFNTAFSNKFCQSEQYLIDPDMEPPQGFEWFFQTGGDRNKYSTHGVLASEIITNADGSETEIRLIDRNKFDPSDFYTGNTWFAYTDKSGKRHVFSKDVVFNDQKSDLMNLGNLFKIPADNEWEKVRDFLENLQLYPKGYFSRFAKTVNLNCFV